jgi:hypothetical protein
MSPFPSLHLLANPLTHPNYLLESAYLNWFADILIKQCPHASAPLSRGAPFDIEDFGVALSAGITCPKHDWSFDLFSGRADRGAYKLKIWEVEVRERGSDEAGDGNGDGDGREVWVRRRQRIG